jgi:putative transposase
MDENGFVLDILLQRHLETAAAKIFLTRLLGECNVPVTAQRPPLRRESW